MSDHITKADPLLKTDVELLEFVLQRMVLPSKETGISDFHVLEGAIGALFVGQRYGLRILRIIHSSKTLKQYERFYGVPLEELVPQHGAEIDRAYVWRFVTTARQYWDLVSRQFKTDDGVKLESHERRAIIDSGT